VQALQQAVYKTESSLEEARRKHATQSAKFLQLLSVIEVLRGTDLPLQNEEVQLRERLEGIQRDMQIPQARLNEITTALGQVEQGEDTVHDIENTQDLAAIAKVYHTIVYS